MRRKLTRVWWAVQLFVGVVGRRTADGTRLPIRDAWRIAGIDRRLKEVLK